MIPLTPLNLLTPSVDSADSVGSDPVKVSKVSAFVNFLFTLFKGVAGISVGSTALIADAVHSLIDVIGSVFVWIGIRVSEKPADKTHPYGHFKAESLAEMAVGIIIVLSSFFIIYEALNELIGLMSPDFEYYALAVAVSQRWVMNSSPDTRFLLGGRLGLQL